MSAQTKFRFTCAQLNAQNYHYKLYLRTIFKLIIELSFYTNK